MSHLVHLAGPPIRVRNVIRQRCAWCGAVLQEDDLDRIAWVAEEGAEDEHPLIEPDGTPKARWAGLVAVEEGNPTAKWAVEESADREVPSDSCMALDPAVTG